MSRIQLSAEQQRAVCEDLLAIEEAGLLPRLATVRRQMLRERLSASAWGQVAIDRLSGQAATFIGGSPGYWREAAAAVLGIPSTVDVCIEAICQVADDVQRQEQERERVAQQEPRRAAPRHRLTIGSGKRGWR